MKTYFADANIFLRFILKDHEKLTAKSRQYFSQAKSKQITLIVLSEIILEIEYVLRKVYKISRKEIGVHLSNLVNTSFFLISERTIYAEAIKIYNQTNLDLVDIFLFLKAKKENAQVLSFDRDFKKLNE